MTDQTRPEPVTQQQHTTDTDRPDCDQEVYVNYRRVQWELPLWGAAAAGSAVGTIWAAATVFHQVLGITEPPLGQITGWFALLLGIVVLAAFARRYNQRRSHFKAKVYAQLRADYPSFFPTSHTGHHSLNDAG